MATHPHSALVDLGPLLQGVGKTALSVPDGLVDLTCDVSPWVARKWAAISAHRSEVERERPLPGILTRLPEDVRHRIIATEHFMTSTPHGRPRPGQLGEP
ncbi:hypothetical protein ACIGZJ_14350 [Kitasatospora sp. NPDC052868]|uniref:hypothetical protein n=1 Tax=Kitasatospora sp. NPDC052868 TaxID=3364060 RepID=UPI0037C65C0D